MEKEYTEDLSVSGQGNEWQIRRRLIWTVVLAVSLSMIVLYLEGRLSDPYAGRPAAFGVRTLAYVAVVYGLICLLNVMLIAYQGSRLDDQVFGFVGAASIAGGLTLFERWILDEAVHVGGGSVDVSSGQIPEIEAAVAAILVAVGLLVTWLGTR